MQDSGRNCMDAAPSVLAFRHVFRRPPMYAPAAGADGVGRAAGGGQPGAHRPRGQRPHPRRGPRTLADHADAARAHRRARTAADRLAQPQGCRRVGGDRDEAVGLRSGAGSKSGTSAVPAGSTSGWPCTSPRRSRTRWSVRRWPGRTAPTVWYAPRRRGLILPEQPSADELTAYLDGKAGSVAGRIVLVGAGTPVPVSFSKAPLRRNPDDLAAMFDPSQSRVRRSPAPRPPPAPPAGRRCQPRRRGDSRRARLPHGSTHSCSPTRPVSASTMPAVTTGRFAPSTTRPSTARRPRRRSSCATRTSAASPGSSTTAGSSSSRSTSPTAGIPRGGRRSTRSPRSPGPTRPAK